MINTDLTPHWSGEQPLNNGTSNNEASRYDILNDELAVTNDVQSKAKEDYYAAKKQSEINNSMFGGTSLANTPNLETASGVQTSTAKALATFGVTLLQGALMGSPVGIAAAMGLNNAAKQYGRDMNRSYRLNQAQSGLLDNYTDLSVQDYIMSGNRDGLKLLEEENSQIRKFNERPDKEQYIGSGEVFTKLTGLDATAENGYQGAGMYGKQWNSFNNSYDSWAKSGDTRATEEQIRKSKETPVGDTKEATAFAGGGVSFVNPQGETQTLYRKNDGRFYDASNNPVDVVGEGWQESDTRALDHAYNVIRNPNDYSQQEVANANRLIGREQEVDLNRGRLSSTEYKEADAELFADSNAIRLTDTLTTMANDLAAGGHSAKGLSVQEWMNSYTSMLGLPPLGNQEAERLYNRLNSGDLEVVRELAQAFRPVSDSQIKLVQDSLRGSTMEARAESLATTRNNLAESFNRNLERYQNTYGAQFDYDPVSFSDNRGADFSGGETGLSDDDLINKYNL